MGWILVIALAQPCSREQTWKFHYNERVDEQTHHPPTFEDTREEVDSLVTSLDEHWLTIVLRCLVDFEHRLPWIADFLVRPIVVLVVAPIVWIFRRFVRR